MANNKKKTKGRKNNVVNKNVNKVEVAKTKEENEESFSIKEFVIVVVSVTLIFGLIYLLTVGAGKLGWFDEHYTKPAIEEAEISYDDILVGTILNRSEYEYYVALGDMENGNTTYLAGLVSAYKNKENALKIYIVNLSDGLNKSVVSDESNTMVSNVNDLKINDQTLLHIKNKKVVESFVGIDNIENVLK